MEEPAVPWWVAYDRLLERLSPVAQEYVLRWFVVPWSLDELVEGEPDGEAVLDELRSAGVVREVNGLLELCLLEKEVAYGKKATSIYRSAPTAECG